MSNEDTHQGEQGIQGEQGVQGVQGIQGVQGLPGQNVPNGDLSLAIINGLPGIFFMYTYPECRLILWNKQHEVVLGYTADELRNKYVADFHVPTVRHSLMTAIEGVMTTGSGSIEDILVTKDGRELPFYSTAVRFETGESKYFIGLCTDLSALKQAEALLHDMTEQRDTVVKTLDVVVEQIRHRPISKWFLVAAWSSIISAVGIGFLCLFWLLWPYRGMQATMTLKTAGAEVPVGSLLTYTAHYCVDSSVPVPITVNRMFELQSDDEKMTFPIAPPLSYTIRERCETVHRVVGVPSYMPVGRYHIHSFTSLKVNPLRSIEQTFQSNDFNLVAEKR